MLTIEKVCNGCYKAWYNGICVSIIERNGKQYDLFAHGTWSDKAFRTIADWKNFLFFSYGKEV